MVEALDTALLIMGNQSGRRKATASLAGANALVQASEQLELLWKRNFQPAREQDEPLLVRTRRGSLVLGGAMGGR